MYNFLPGSWPSSVLAPLLARLWRFLTLGVSILDPGVAPGGGAICPRNSFTIPGGQRENKIVIDIILID